MSRRERRPDFEEKDNRKKIKKNKTEKIHVEGDRRRIASRVISIIASLVMILVIAWNTYQIFNSVVMFARYVKGEPIMAAVMDVARIIIRVGCIAYAVAIIIEAFQVWLVRRADWKQAKHRRLSRNTVRLTCIGVGVMLLSLGDLVTNYLMCICLLAQMALAIMFSMRKGQRLAVWILTVVYIVGIIAILYISLFDRSTREPLSDQTGVSTESASNSVMSQLWEMSAYPEYFHMTMYANNLRHNYGLITVPGLLYADSINAATKQVDTCTQVTPQGLAISDKYIFVSAYCHTKNHKSMIFVIDRKNGEYVKEIVLADRTHAGGLAYDPSHNVLWIATKINKTDEDGNKERVAAVGCITLEEIENYDFKETGQPLKYHNACATMFENTSFITYYDGYLYSGYWLASKKKTSLMAKFKITDDGISLEKLPDMIASIPGQVQGMMVYKDKVIFATSYGIDESKLKIYKNGDDILKFDNKVLIRNIELPQKLEQIYSYGGRLYLLFESGSYAYRLTAPVCMDHIVSMNENTITVTE